MRMYLYQTTSFLPLNIQVIKSPTQKIFLSLSQDPIFLLLQALICSNQHLLNISFTSSPTHTNILHSTQNNSELLVVTPFLWHNFHLQISSQELFQYFPTTTKNTIMICLEISLDEIVISGQKQEADVSTVSIFPGKLAR